MSPKLSSMSAFAGTIAVSLWVWVPAASSGPLSSVEGRTVYAPIQSISYEFGSKWMSGYFVQQANNCVVTLMIAERTDLEERLLPPPATRVRLVLQPKQIAGLDSEEGRSLNFTCGDDATSLIVDAGDRESLVKLQQRALQDTIAQKP